MTEVFRKEMHDKFKIVLATVKLTPSLCWTRVLQVAGLGGPQKRPGEGGGHELQKSPRPSPIVSRLLRQPVQSSPT
jgi:hypothetical protein